MTAKSFGRRFFDALILLSDGVVPECELYHTLWDVTSTLKVASLDKYPFAILRFIKAAWNDIEDYLNSNPAIDEDRTEKFIVSIARLEALEEELQHHIRS